MTPPSPSETYALVVLAATIVAALVTLLVFERVVARFAAKTSTHLDDLVVRQVRTPLALTFVAGGSWYAIVPLGLPDSVRWTLRGLLMSGLVVLWTLAAARIAFGVLEWLATRPGHLGVVAPRTLPLFEIGARTVVYGGAIYFLFLAWDVDLTAWLASAGIVGIAVGFAAKDSLANLFAGVSIVADAPYKLGDYLVLDSGERGRVTEIGIRATRILTRDDVEIIIPNSVMANAKISNQSTPNERFRVRAPVDVAYGSDIDEVRRVLKGVPDGVPGVVASVAPVVRFRELGNSGLRFEVLFWVERPELRGSVIDEINTRIYKRFAEARIEIPYSKHDVYLHTAPAPRADGP